MMRGNTTLAFTFMLIKSPDLKSEACPLQSAGMNWDGES